MHLITHQITEPITTVYVIPFSEASMQADIRKSICDAGTIFYKALPLIRLVRILVI